MGCFETSGGRRLLVDNQVTVVQGLNPKEVEFEIRQRVESRRHLLQIVFEQILTEPSDRYPPVNGFPEPPTVKVPQRPHPIPHDVPTEHLLINKGELDPAGKLREIGIFFDQGLGVEADGIVQVRFFDSVKNRAPQLLLDLPCPQA